MTKQEFDEYVQAQGADILRFCRMTTASKIEGDELYQDTMLKLLEQLQHLNVDKNLKSYTLSVAIFLWKNQRRKYARRKRLASFESYETQNESGNLKVISADTKTPEQTVVQNETNALVQKMVFDLPEKYRTVIELFYSADLKISEIATCLQVSENTVKSRLRRAKMILKKKLEAAL